MPHWILFLLDWILHIHAHHHFIVHWVPGRVSLNPPPTGPGPGTPHCTPTLC